MLMVESLSLPSSALFQRERSPFRPEGGNGADRDSLSLIS